MYMYVYIVEIEAYHINMGSLPIGRGSEGSIKLIVDLCPLFTELLDPLFTSSTREITLAVGGEDC